LNDQACQSSRLWSDQTHVWWLASAVGQMLDAGPYLWHLRCRCQPVQPRYASHCAEPLLTVSEIGSRPSAL